MKPRIRPWMITIPIILLLGVGSSRFVGSGYGDPWFDGLAKPWFMPPGWAFPVVWTTLYILMGIALSDMIEAGARGLTAVRLFAVQLVLNLAWPPIFFALHQIGAALVVIIVLELVVLALIVVAARAGLRRAALLLVPYALWLAIATALNHSILTNNG